MATIHVAHMSFVFGLLGNIVSFLVYLAPSPTFYRICKRKSTEEFQSLPYSVALFSAMLTLYYAFLKTSALLLITINCIGIAIESIYLAMYMIYAPGRAKIYTAKLLTLFNVGFFGLIMLFTSPIRESSLRLTAVGWICAIVSVCVYASPLSVMAPNILGFGFGTAQMILYTIYKDKKKDILPEFKLQDVPNGTTENGKTEKTETLNETKDSTVK
ncbi:Bidirectional sugar transporter NEC1 [Morella rubra]|uniref:Bidirectional sugar transporter NEC1 n=1 Tax=Morella rubra TaxID=262757 RepID=A0A6A1W067_9ROSI|nr:Bidirectional sugar transporter NEC1 [Morella rubra]